MNNLHTLLVIGGLLSPPLMAAPTVDLDRATVVLSDSAITSWKITTNTSGSSASWVGSGSIFINGLEITSGTSANPISDWSGTNASNLGSSGHLNIPGGTSNFDTFDRDVAGFSY